MFAQNLEDIKTHFKSIREQVEREEEAALALIHKRREETEKARSMFVEAEI